MHIAEGRPEGQVEVVHRNHHGCPSRELGKESFVSLDTVNRRAPPRTDRVVRREAAKQVARTATGKVVLLATYVSRLVGEAPGGSDDLQRVRLSPGDLRGEDR